MNERRETGMGVRRSVQAAVVAEGHGMRAADCGGDLPRGLIVCLPVGVVPGGGAPLMARDVGRTSPACFSHHPLLWAASTSCLDGRSRCTHDTYGHGKG